MPDDYLTGAAVSSNQDTDGESSKQQRYNYHNICAAFFHTFDPPTLTQKEFADIIHLLYTNFYCRTSPVMEYEVKK